MENVREDQWLIHTVSYAFLFIKVLFVTGLPLEKLESPWKTFQACAHGNSAYFQVLELKTLVKKNV